MNPIKLANNNIMNSRQTDVSLESLTSCLEQFKKITLGEQTKSHATLSDIKKFNQFKDHAQNNACQTQSRLQYVQTASLELARPKAHKRPFQQNTETTDMGDISKKSRLNLCDL